MGLRVLSDDRLARMVASGSEPAFEIISERYQGALYRHCRAILNHHEDASDALQNTLLNAYRALSSKPRDLALRPWLFRIAHNESISLLRRRRPHAELDEAAGASRPGADHDAETNARLRQLVSDLQQLSERQRGALVMREISGLSYGDIAASFAISENAAKQTVHEAHSALHDLEAGRAMDCETVRTTLSVGDRRLLRGRKVRAHLRGCDGCTSFHDAIHSRRRDLAALAPPIPASLAVALLHSLFGGSGGGGGGGGLLGGGGGGGLLGGGGTTATATTAATGGLAATTGATVAVTGTGAAATGVAAASGGASGGILAALTGATGPALVGAGVVKSLVPAAVGLTVGAGALGLSAPEPVTKAITEVERALEPREVPATLDRAATAPAASAPLLSPAPGSSMAAPSLVALLTLPDSPEAQRHGAGAVTFESSSPRDLSHVHPTVAGTPNSAPPDESAPPVASPPSSAPSDAPAATPVAADLKPEATNDPSSVPSSEEGTRFESVQPTDAPPSAPEPDAAVEPAAGPPSYHAPIGLPDPAPVAPAPAEASGPAEAVASAAPPVVVPDQPTSLSPGSTEPISGL